MLFRLFDDGRKQWLSGNVDPAYGAGAARAPGVLQDDGGRAKLRPAA